MCRPGIGFRPGKRDTLPANRRDLRRGADGPAARAWLGRAWRVRFPKTRVLALRITVIGPAQPGRFEAAVRSDPGGNPSWTADSSIVSSRGIGLQRIIPA